MVLVGVLFLSVPNLAKQPVETDRSYKVPSDFENGTFTTGNGTVVGRAIISNDTRIVQYQFGPFEKDDWQVIFVKANYKATNGNISVLWKENFTATQWKRATLESGKTYTFYKRPVQVMFLVSIGPETGSSVSDIKTQMKFTPPLNILNELMSRPWLIAGLGLAAVMAGAFAPAALAGLADESNKKARGMTMAVYIVMLSLGQVVGPPVTGYLMDNFGGIGFMFFLVISGIILGLIMLAKWLDKRSCDRKARKSNSQEEE
jgi:F0F1-type ATP synthase assembly protein I